MYSFARIAGLSEQLQQLSNTLLTKDPMLRTRFNDQNELVCNLTTSPVGDWVEVEDALWRIEEAIKSAEIGDFGILIETHFVSELLPDGGVVTDQMLVSHMGLSAMASMGADLEIILDPPGITASE